MKSLFCRRLCSCFCGKNPAAGQAAGFFAWILFACAQLLHAVGADVLAAVVLDVPAVTAEDAGRLVLLENNGLAVDIDFLRAGGLVPYGDDVVIDILQWGDAALGGFPHVAARGILRARLHDDLVRASAQKQMLTPPPSLEAKGLICNFWGSS